MRYPIYKTEIAIVFRLKLINILVKMASNVYFPRNLGFHLYGQVLSNSPLCDTIIEVNENKQIFCHAAIISCASDILKELLDLATLNQNGKKVLNFTSACSETMFCVLDYIYTGREVSFIYDISFDISFSNFTFFLFRPTMQQMWLEYWRQHYWLVVEQCKRCV